MSHPSFASQLVNGRLAKAFLPIGYKALLPGAAPETASRHFISSFAVQLNDHVVLVTAGHVIQEIRDKMAAGVSYSGFHFHDVKNGSFENLALPYGFDLEDWVCKVEDHRGDFAFLILRPLYEASMKAAGVEPITADLWRKGDEPLEVFQHFGVLGIPGESYEMKGGVESVKLTFIPLLEAEVPQSIIDKRIDDADLNPNYADWREFGKLSLSTPGMPPVVDSIEGMSGGPVVGLRKDASGVTRFFLVGYISSWYRSYKLACFYRVDYLLEVLLAEEARLKSEI